MRAGTAPPLLADWRPRIGPGTLPSLALAALACSPALHRACDRLGWRRLLGAAWMLGVVWMLCLAFVDGLGGISRPLDQSTEYLPTARAVDDVQETLRGFDDRIPFDRPDHWPVHVAGHPPGALLLFVALVRVGLASGPAVGLVVVAVAATTPLAVATALRALGAEDLARIALPFLVIGPAAIWQAVSADAVFAAVGAWGTAALATSTTMGVPALRSGALWPGPLWRACCSGSASSSPMGWSSSLCSPSAFWSPPADGCLWSSPSLPASLSLSPSPRQDSPGGRLFPFCASATRTASPASALRPTGCGQISPRSPSAPDQSSSALCGRRWPASTWGPSAEAHLPLRRRSDAPAPVLVAAAVAMVALADLSLMSKAEVERIWLPFVPWLAISAAMLPPAWRRPALASQAVLALAVQHFLWTPW